MKVIDTRSNFSKVANTPKLHIPKNNLWVFGYGSLMWNPGFSYIESKTAQIYGFHRRLCLWSTQYRGTKNNPGLIVGLDRGGSCKGLAFCVNDKDISNTVSYLFERELVTDAYKPIITPIHLDGGNIAQALTFISIVDHPQYAQKMDYHSAIGYIRKAKGPQGTNKAYLLNTVEQLNLVGIHNSELHKIVAAL